MLTMSIIMCNLPCSLLESTGSLFGFNPLDKNVLISSPINYYVSLTWLTLHLSLRFDLIREDSTSNLRNLNTYLYLTYLFLPFFCADTFDTILLLIVCALRLYVKSLYRHLFLEDTCKKGKGHSKNGTS